ncbi:hypothetical protein CONLIGDRAFT_40688 [Coniochaeta ligniaria NRRL 30616]|uniref:SAM and PH domain-containing protein n=1 Tax=Coniochaeta ligniaria NRRL 30616 TaxID=1408157 RepID=A0A1J7J6G4_9PEZI|nr:hypothetical protein CONLIGDRAFT_40688 [Coniochaeta ligniaria NRRL 30616]
METLIQFSPQERPHREMLERPGMRDSIFSMGSTAKPRPVSVATEFMEDWEVDDEALDTEIEDIEDEGENSPRVSLNSSGQPSFTTLSSYDEVQTPSSLRNRNPFLFDSESKQVEGPRGPHLFRSSMASSHSIEFQHALSLSPLTPKGPNTNDFQVPIALELTQIPGKKKRDSGPFSYTTEELDTKTLPEWSPEKVAQWMHNAGVGLNDCDFFVENDITGAILITLKFEDLKELGIPSFGVRTKIWDEIHNMRNIRKPEPVMETDIEDAPDKEARRELRRQGSSERAMSKKRFAPKFNDVISPLESVSIVGIEQMMPRPHKCSKGENCAKWKRNQRLIEAFKKDHPFVDMDKGGIIMMAGDPGNAALAAANAEYLPQPRFPSIDDAFRPISDAMPSVVASSDVMGPGMPPLQYLEAATLRALQQRDPQDNVRQFLDFQQQHPSESSEVPPTPPFEIFPAQQTPHQGLRSLPKLSIPGQVAPPRRQQHPLAAAPMVSDVESEEDSPEETTPTAPYRFGTPFSEMDVPVTSVNLGPIARDASQSVPPDMNYRHNPAPPKRSASRASVRRPSFPVMPALDENSIVSPIHNQPGRSFAQRAAGAQRPIQPPPRVQYPWTQAKPYEKAIAPIPGSACASAATSASNISAGAAIVRHHSPPTGTQSGDMTNGDAISYQGLMKKRKTKMLRHEWHEHYFTLRGTRLAMHKDPAQVSRTLEYIDVDDYAIACSSLASSKLNAAFKAMNIRNNKAKDDIAAFSFQLIPQDQKGGVRLRKRESAAPASAHPGNGSTSTLGSIPEGVNGTGKTHHFAVKGRDERIDWMRELMLAKALKQKGEGVEISVNGNMI